VASALLVEQDTLLIEKEAELIALSEMYV